MSISSDKTLQMAERVGEPAKPAFSRQKRGGPAAKHRKNLQFAAAFFIILQYGKEAGHEESLDLYTCFADPGRSAAAVPENPDRILKNRA